MPNSFSPTPQDVERYRHLRAVNIALNRKIVKTIPRRAYDDIGDALGIRRNGVLEFDSEDMTSVLADCCLYDWYENGKNLVQRYAEAHPATEDTEESYLLQACLRAQYRVLVADSVVPGAGIYCQDVLNGGELFLMDLAISQGVANSNVALATRTIPLGEYWMTGGAGLPINSQESVVDTLRRIARDGKPPQGARGVALTVARACLASGAANHVRYESAEASPKASARKPLRMPRWSGYKRRCR
jgi:hypothetical protein